MSMLTLTLTTFLCLGCTHTPMNSCLPPLNREQRKDAPEAQGKLQGDDWQGV